MTIQVDVLCRAFEDGSLDPATFGHLEHLAVAWALLGRYGFVEGSAHFARGVRALAARAGAPEKFHATVTYGYLSLVAERMQQGAAESFAGFLERNHELRDASVLSKRYTPARLASDEARQVMLLPDLPVPVRSARPPRPPSP